jgi:hypothetical protein
MPGKNTFDDEIRQAMEARGIQAPSAGAGSMFDVGQPTNAQGLIEPGNINIHRRPVVHNADGSISTVRSASFEDENGHNVLIPTVIPGRGVVPMDQAIKYYQQTGEHLGKFDTVDNADTYAQALHEQQAGEYQ